MAGLPGCQSGGGLVSAIGRGGATPSTAACHRGHGLIRAAGLADGGLAPRVVRAGALSAALRGGGGRLPCRVLPRSSHPAAPIALRDARLFARRWGAAPPLRRGGIGPAVAALPPGCSPTPGGDAETPQGTPAPQAAAADAEGRAEPGAAAPAPPPLFLPHHSKAQSDASDWDTLSHRFWRVRGRGEGGEENRRGSPWAQSA